MQHIVRFELPERRKKQEVQVLYRNPGVDIDVTGADFELLEAELLGLKEQVQLLEQERAELKKKQDFSLKNVGDDSNRLRFYTNFGTLSALKVCFNFLGPAVN